MSRYPRPNADRQFTPMHLASCVLTVSAAISTAAIGDSVSQPQREKQSRGDAVRPGLLQPLQSVVGSWRGVGQPRRGSRKGAWQETAVCRWDFSAKHPAIRFDTEHGLQFEKLTMMIADDGKSLELHQQINKQSSRIYYGRVPAKWPTKLQLLSAPEDDGSRHRCTIEQLKDIRLVMLFERQASSAAGFRRVAGIGYTRSGHKLAAKAGNQRECIVTGGQGTIPVLHKGKTWYVCCEGCRQAFEESPDEIVTNYLVGTK